MEVSQLEHLVTLRTVVGYLGEREQYAWWQSSFFASGSRVFLAPLFGKTQLLAQCRGVTRAACVIYDERIGVGSVYHLFRLPEDVEQGLHRVLYDPGLCGKITALVTNKDAALGYLRKEAGPPASAAIGPTRIGGTPDLRDPGHWSVAAAHYARAFDHGAEVFPYFADRT